jgi:hypothetical protein
MRLLRMLDIRIAGEDAHPISRGEGVYSTRFPACDDYLLAARILIAAD